MISTCYPVKYTLKLSKSALLGFGMILMLFSASAQVVPGVEETGIVYKYADNWGATLHSSGIGVNYRKGRHTSGYSYLMSDFSLLTMRHPKEVRTVNPFSDNNSGFIYGKLNSFMMLHTGIGIQKTINAKGDKGGIEVGHGFYAGVSWGIIKPVYLTIFYKNDQDGIRERIERYNPDKHYPDNISGRASFFRGFKQARLDPGLYASYLLNFEFGKSQERLRMIETGVSVDLFAKPVPMMAFNTNTNYFLTFFVRILYGKLWNRR